MNVGAIKYDRVVSSDDGSSVSKLIKWIKPNSKVLECGPATGIMTKILSGELACEVTAIEIDSEAAERAKPFCKEMIVDNLETMDFEKELGKAQFDYIIFADVLEHLISPLKVLEKIKPFLSGTGEILVSIPNISHAVILGELIQGKFDYQTDGLLDNTHLRFFTRKTFRELCESAQLGILEWDRTVRSPSSTEFAVSFEQLPAGVKNLFKSYPDSDTYQFLTRLSKSLPSVQAEVSLEVGRDRTILVSNFRSSVAYYSETPSFSEANKDHKLVPHAGRKMELKFSIPAGTKHIRFDPVDSKEAFALIKMELLDNGTKPVWKWQVDGESNNNYYTQNIGETRAIHSVLNFPLNNDPQIYINLQAPLKSECSFCALISFDIPHYFEEFAAEVKHLIDAKQLILDDLHREIENFSLANKVLTGRAEAAENALSHQMTELTMNSSEKGALIDRINHLQALLDGMWTSKSWKVTRPLRAGGLIYKSVRGIIRKVTANIKSKLKSYAYKNYSFFKYLSDRNYLSELECYQIWTAHQEKPDLGKVFSYTPKISIILPVYKTPLTWLKECIQSVTSQSYENWELCIADDHSNDPGIRSLLSTFEAADKRIKVVYREENGHIAECSQSALKIASGEFVCLLDHDDLLHKDALFWVVDKLNEDPSLDFIYSNEDKLNLQGNFDQPAFKPAWSPEYFLSFMYTGHLATYRTDLVRKVGGFRKGTEGSQDYDLTLRVTEKTDKISHIPKILYHWREHEDSIALNLNCKDYAFDAAKKSLISHISKTSQISYEVYDSNFKGIYRIKASEKINYDVYSYKKDISFNEFKIFISDCVQKSSSGILIFHSNDCVYSKELQVLICSPLEIKGVVATSPILTHNEKVVSCGYGIYDRKIIPLAEGSSFTHAGFGGRLAAMHNTALVTLDYMAVRRDALSAALESIKQAGTFAEIALSLSFEFRKSKGRIVLVPEKVEISREVGLVAASSLPRKFADFSDPYLSKNICFENKNFSYV
jgi:glycosyltransferase involved in cell wall biosynthesis/2-polyprenyl-3-methyl-5-hydroxy-6-metoxy-1,4-benzoquinol methylase